LDSAGKLWFAVMSKAWEVALGGEKNPLERAAEWAAAVDELKYFSEVMEPIIRKRLLPEPVGMPNFLDLIPHLTLLAT